MSWRAEVKPKWADGRPCSRHALFIGYGDTPMQAYKDALSTLQRKGFRQAGKARIRKEILP
jgi:GTP cyclohydrolase III